MEEVWKVTPFECWIKEIAKPGMCAYIYGTDERGIPYEPQIVEITKVHMLESDICGIKRESYLKKENVPESMQEPGHKLLVKTVKANYSSMTFLQEHLRKLIRASKNLPSEFKRWLELKHKIHQITECTDEELQEFQQLQDKLAEISSLKNKRNELFSDQERYKELKMQNVKLRRNNGECTTPDELELLKLYRRIYTNKQRQEARKQKSTNTQQLPIV